MNLNENLEAAKNAAVEAAQVAVRKARQLAAIAKANVAIYTEEDKIRKAERELGKLYYRDYAVGEEQDSAEYLPWCQKIDESKQTIAALQEQITQIREQDSECCDESDEGCCCSESGDKAEGCCCEKPAEIPEKSEQADRPEASVEIKIEGTDTPEE